MSMILKNNMAAQLSLGEVNKNVNKLGKALAKVSSGMKINSAQDDSAMFAVSEVMRVRIRALEQDIQNVQNGSMLLKTAEEGIQQQIDLVRTIKEKVIDACNDTNTDWDRKIIQKEINQLFDQVDQTAYYTNYNTKNVLLGNTYWQTTARYISLGASLIDEKSADMEIIPNIYPTLDGVDGPFDIFTEYGTYSDTAKILTVTTDEHEVTFTAGANGTAKELTIDLSGYNINQLKSQNTGFRVTAPYTTASWTTSRDFVLTTNTAQNFNTGSYYGMGSSYVTATANGNVITLVSANESSDSNNMNVTTCSGVATTTENTTSTVESGTSTGRITSTNGQMKGGKDASGTPGLDDPDMVYTPPTAPSLGPINMSGITLPSGITIKGFYTAYLEFQEGSAGLSYDSSRGVYTVGIDASVSNQTVDSTRMALTLQNGNLSFTATQAGATANNYKITDGYNVTTQTPNGTFTTYAEVTANTATVTTTVQGADSDARAYYDIDLSSYTDVENFIDDIVGKSLRYSYYGNSVNFYDSADSQSMKSLTATTSYNLDLNLVRQDVEDYGMSIAESFATRFKSTYSYRSYVNLLDADGNEVTDNSDISILRINSVQKGSRGNNDKLSIWSTQFRHYDIDYGTWFAENTDKDIPEYLDGKGFRFYCATDANQWFNIIFKSDFDLERPTNETGEDIKSIEIDVSQVTDANSLIQAIYDQAMPLLTGDDPDLNHHHRIAIDTETGVLTVYDRRNWNVQVEGYDYQTLGAKIADGVADNVIKVKKDLLIHSLVIQDTDHDSMNIRVKIPDMRLNSIFGILPDYGRESILDYSLTSKSDRDALIGNGYDKGILDSGLDYLLNAAVMVGAQNARLEYTQANIVTQDENTIASESVIRDADMAKEMTEYTKLNVLAQSSQAMLAQANQNLSGVLSLLQ